MKTTTYKKLSTPQKKLLDEAEKVMENSYNPYSNFSVGAALLTKGNKIITGTNFENAAYGDTLCAERAAIVRANSEGERAYKAIAIIGKGLDFGTKDVKGPCGSCRQVLYEASKISGTNLEVIVSTTKKDKILIGSIEELLPFPFGPEELGIDIKKYQK